MPKYFLQNRWMPEGNALVYYGLRNKENMFRNRVRLSKKQAELVSQLPKELSKKEKRTLKGLLGTQIVPEEERHETPGSLREARFCSTCAANDYMIPGLEFDEEGRCPMCQTAEQFADMKSILPVMNEVPKSKKSRFDIAVFYTGGKDSIYLLYYLSKVQGLRVLALTWEIPFMSDSARKSIENAKKAFRMNEKRDSGAIIF